MDGADPGSPSATGSTPDNTANPAPATAAPIEQDAPSDKPAEKVAGGYPSIGFANLAPLGVLLAGAILLLFVGILLRRLVARALARRRTIRVERQEPVLIADIAATRPVPTLVSRSPSLVPVAASGEQQIADVEEALRKLGARLRRRRLTPFKTIAPFFSGEPVASRGRS